MTEDRINSIVLISLAVITAFLCFLILRPFVKPLIFALVLVILLYPLHSRILRLQLHPNLAALLSTVLVAFFVAVPLFGLGGVLASELKGVYQVLVTSANAQGGPGGVGPRSMEGVMRWLGDFLGFPGLQIESVLRSQMERMIGYLIGMAADALRNAVSAFGDALASLFILFFLFRDGPAIKDNLISLLPSARERFEQLFRHISETLLATVYGTLLIASIQGGLTGVAFWLLGLPSPALWGAVAGIFALIPVIGTGFVWIPAAAILAFGGHIGKAVALTIWCSVVVHPVDNIARPYIISGRVKGLNTLYLFLALVGGLKAFGFLGLLTGPVVFSLSWALFRMLQEQMKERFQTQHHGEAGVSEEFHLASTA